MKQKLLTLVLLLTALCVALCGCTAQDVTLPAQVDMVPGTTLTLADLAEYSGPDLSRSAVRRWTTSRYFW